MPEPEADLFDKELYDAVLAHCEPILGRCETVFHEEGSRKVHIDLNVFPEDPDTGAITLVSTGMASQPMNVPAEVQNPDQYAFAELVMQLPPDWPLTMPEFELLENRWPVDAMSLIARLPHQEDTWVWGGHTVSNGGEAKPYAPDTGLCAALITPCFSMPGEFETLVLPDGREIVFLQVAFLYKEELAYAREHYSQGLFQRFQEAGMSPLDFYTLHKARPNVCA